MSTFFYVPQYFTTQLSVAGGIDDTQTAGIVLQDISGVDATKPGIIALTWSNPIDTSKIEYIFYTSINDSTKELQGVTRGQEGYSAKSHLNGATVAWPLSKSHINNIPDYTTIFTNKDLTSTTNTFPIYCQNKVVSIQVVAGGDSVAIADGQAYITIPEECNGMNLVGVHARVVTAGTTNTTDIQIRNVTDSVDMLSTKITIDSGETGSDTAATPAVIDTTKDDVATNDLLAIDIDAVSTTAPKGLIVVLRFAKA